MNFKQKPKTTAEPKWSPPVVNLGIKNREDIQNVHGGVNIKQ